MYKLALPFQAQAIPKDRLNLKYKRAANSMHGLARGAPRLTETIQGLI